MKRWRKGGFVFLESWVEISFFILLVLGFGLGKLVVDTALSYLLVAAAGIITGRLGYVRREDDPWPYYAISLAFLFGFLLAHRVGSGIVIILIFVAAALVSYKAHQSFEFLA